MRMFRTSYHIRCLQNEESPKKFHRVKKELFQISSQSDDQIIVWHQNFLLILDWFLWNFSDFKKHLKYIEKIYIQIVYFQIWRKEKK